MIKKIQSINNLAVFNDFNWDDSVKDKQGNVCEFKNINILYGRNYSGKTTHKFPNDSKDKMARYW